LYKPKAVVSGDFYCGYKKGDSLVIIAADCTGHGVPGAFMSMLGLAFLDDIFNNYDSLSAADILNKLREQVVNKLSQKNTSVQMRDGMDISVCILNRSSGSLEFSGANNPLYLVRNGTLIKLAADKMPIGIYSQAMLPFSNRIHDLKKRDVFYLFSDGYADQFGGNYGRKMMYKQFQDVLIKNHDRPMEEQKRLLDDHFESWKGNYEQVDDVLVIGIQV
jgi:serine phosphatase RsbU (regulator of sigma subunit)